MCFRAIDDFLRNQVPGTYFDYFKDGNKSVIYMLESFPGDCYASESLKPLSKGIGLWWCLDSTTLPWGK